MISISTTTLLIAIPDRLKAELLMKIEADLGCNIVQVIFDERVLMAQIQKHRPNFLLLDPDLISSSYGDFVKELGLMNLPTRLIILSAYAKSNHLKSFLLTNGAGFIQKNIGYDEFISTIKSIISGRTLILANIESQLSERKKTKIDGLETLTSREREIWNYLLNSKSEKQIAQELSIKVSTVKTHKIHISEKLNIKKGEGLTSFISKTNVF